MPIEAWGEALTGLYIVMHVFLCRVACPLNERVMPNFSQKLMNILFKKNILKIDWIKIKFSFKFKLLDWFVRLTW